MNEAEKTELLVVRVTPRMDAELDVAAEDQSVVKSEWVRRKLAVALALQDVETESAND